MSTPGARLPSVENIQRLVRGHESGRHVPGDVYAELYCRAFGLSTWSCPGPRRALYALSVAIRLRDPDEALRAADDADAAWAAGEPWLYGVWALVRIGAATAHVMKGDLDAAAGQLRAVMALAPPLRISAITRYLADVDALLAQARFGGNTAAADMRAVIRAFSDAAAPATCGDGDNR